MPSSAELLCVDPAQVGHFWPHVEPLLRPAIEDVGLNGFDEIEASILCGQALVWLAWGDDRIMAAAATEMSLVGDTKICTLVACGGREVRSWVALLGKIEQYAKAEGCTAMRIYGRNGWQKLLDGYARKAIVLEKAL